MKKNLQLYKNSIEHTEDMVVPKDKWIPNELFQTIQQSIPIACVDLIILRRNNGIIETLLIKRKIYPEVGKWCLIGGRIIKGEHVNDTIRRQAKIELGISVDIISPWNETTPIMSLSDPLSDAQKHFVVLVYPVTISKGQIKESGPEFSEAKWFSLDKIPETLGFAHQQELGSFITTKLDYEIK
jgi:ADP-ribose pyrophosphatase YjhB (NUDIX family)